MKNYFFWLQYLSRHTGSLVLVPEPSRANGRTVVLVHGILCRAETIRFLLGDYLAQQGFKVYVYDYATTRDDVRTHGEHLRDYLEAIPEEFQLVTHSMGGVLTRVALGRPLRRVKRVLMIAPPNRGSRYASWLCRYIPPLRRWWKPLPDMCREEEGTMLTLPEHLGVPVGILAADHDDKVDMELTHFAGETEFDHYPAQHTLIMLHAGARKKILHFLDTGKFS